MQIRIRSSKSKADKKAAFENAIVASKTFQVMVIDTVEPHDDILEGLLGKADEQINKILFDSIDQNHQPWLTGLSPNRGSSREKLL